METEEGTQLRVPTANVGKLEAQTLKAGEYAIYNGSLVEGTEDLPLEVVVNFSATEAEAGSMADWLVDFNLTFTGMENGSIVADNCYLAGNYGTFGWIAIPTDGMVLEDGVTYPVVAVAGIHLNYNDIVTSVKNFIAAIHIDQAILDANPNLAVNLELVMTDPEDADNKIQVGQDMIYTAEDLKNEEAPLPEALVTPMDKITLEEDEYRVWNGVVSDKESEALVPGEGKLPLEVVVNFKAIDTLEECLAGGYAQWLVDFNITIEGLTNGSFVADDCYLAGNYGSYGWIKIPLDGQTISEGIAYPVVALYDPTLNYKDICKSVKDFTAAIHIDQAILDANPDISVKLELIMTNPTDANDTLQIGEDLIYRFDELFNAVAMIKETGEKFSAFSAALEAAENGQTVALLADCEMATLWLKNGKSLDLNGYTLTTDMVIAATADVNIIDSTDGKGLLIVAAENCALHPANASLPVWVAEGGYRFVDVKLKSQASLTEEGNGYFRFYIAGNDANCALQQAMADGGADNHISVRVTLNWVD
ncbi:MAG: hypothetical protein IKB09_00850, partial [Oscillospiraceae bacterium]|nr:hypothetical protein [Oscillospiraceae bacterium]